MRSKLNSYISTDGAILKGGQKMYLFSSTEDVSDTIDNKLSGVYHTHNCISIEFLISGRAINHMNNTDEELLPGSVLLLSQLDFHQIELTEKCYFIYLEFIDSVVSSEVLKLWGTEKPSVTTRFEGADFLYITNLCENLVHEYEQPSFGSDEAISGLLSYLMIKILRSKSSISHEINGSHDENDIIKMLTYIRANFREKITLADLAKEVNLNYNYLCQNFHRYVGMSFRYYLQYTRLTFAMSLVCMTDKSLADICHESGFESVPHFSTAFKKMYGHPPSYFRNRNK